MSKRNGTLELLEWAFTLHLGAPRQPVVTCLAWHADPNGRCFPSQKTICEETGLSIGSVRRALQSLTRGGYIQTVAAGNGHRSASYTLSRGIQPMFPLLAEALPDATTDAEGDHRDHPGVSGRSPRVIKPRPRTNHTTVRRSSPNGEDLRRTDSGTSKDHIERFLGAENPQQQVAALIDLSRAEGVGLKEDRAASIVRRYGHGQAVIDAVFAAKAKRVLEPNDWIEKVLSNGRSRLQEARRPLGEGQGGSKGRQGSPGERAAAFVARERQR